MDKFHQEIKELVCRIVEHGFRVIAEKSINYGVQLKISDDKDTGIINIYNGKKGTTFVVQGSQTPFKNVLKSIVDRNNTPFEEGMEIFAKNKKAPQETISHANEKISENRPHGFENVAGFDGKWIGIDESGKGDFFGPLVVVAVMVDELSALRLESLGIKDSKALSDKKNSALACQIRNVCQNRYRQFKLDPQDYNLLYDEYSKQGQNLNNLLGYAHAKVLEELLEKEPCKFALADKFGAEIFTQDKLLSKGKQISLLQMHRGEQNIAVAAASVLARDLFLERLKEMQEEFGLPFPKGAANVLNAAKLFIEKHGKTSLPLVCKVHFRTYTQIFN